MKNKKILTCIIVFLIFLLGLTLRLYRLNINTPPLYTDEVGHYQYSQLINTSNISSLTKAIRIILYTPISYTWFLGLSTFAARLPSAINGSLICLSVFLFSLSVSEILDKKKKIRISILTCLLSAFLPWSFMMSRLYAHVPLLLVMVCLHLFLFVKSKNIKEKIISLIPLFIGTYFYLSSVILAPIGLCLVLVDALSVIKKEDRWKALSGAFVIGLLLFALFVLKFKIFDPNQRGLDLAIWRDVNVTSDSNLYRGIARQSPSTFFSFGSDTEKIANKIAFNYPTSVLGVFMRNYLSFFSPDFLFLKGDPVLRHSTGMVGQFFPFLAPFMILGAFIFFKKANKRLKYIIIVWILASPIPAAITKDGQGYLLRVLTLMPFLTYFCSLGIIESVTWFKNKAFRILYVLTVILIGLYSAFYFYFGYFHVYPTLAARSFEYGFKELADFQTKNPGKMFILWDDKYPVGEFCFWQKIPYDHCTSSQLNTSKNVNNSRVDLPLDGLLFSLPKNQDDLNEIVSAYQPKYIVIPSKYSLQFTVPSKHWSIVSQINYPDGSIGFTIYQITK